MLSSEAVAGGHPDKIADQISDSILDEHLKQDRGARVACEVLWAGSLIVIGGEITSSAEVDHSAVADRVLRRYGYQASEIRDAVIAQSPEISAGVFGAEQGAGDQGIMFGYATAETSTGLWQPHELALRIIDDFTCGSVEGFKTDAKSQVTVDADGLIRKVVLSAAHDADISIGEVRDALRGHVTAALQRDKVAVDCEFLMNPAGAWTISGAAADAGLTGRKIIVDTYGGRVPHGGGAFSGKDPSKVDRSAAYMARAIAKALVAGEWGDEFLVQLGYAIGIAEPVSVAVCSPSGEERPELSSMVSERLDLRPAAIIELLDLRDFNHYAETAHGGHFSRPWFPWEQEGRVLRELRS